MSTHTWILTDDSRHRHQQITAMAVNFLRQKL